jgi:hypothetical protein
MAMTEQKPKRQWRTGPAPSLPDRKSLTVHMPGALLETLREAARRHGIGVGEMARRMIVKGLKGDGDV